MQKPKLIKCEQAYVKHAEQEMKMTNENGPLHWGVLCIAVRYREDGTLLYYGGGWLKRNEMEDDKLQEFQDEQRQNNRATQTGV